ncbi:hypothetical protein L1F34_002467 [Mammaliicoccus lentus]|uniref:ABC transporter permease subunit n=1 Tax=Mammaliicoccus lentus TaxID=42858 RepID=UPI0039EC2437
MTKLLNIIITIITFLLIACTPSLFENQQFNISKYIRTVKKTSSYIFHPQDITFTNKISNIDRNLFPFFIEPLINSLIILFSSLIIAFIFSFIFTYLLYSNKFIKRYYVKLNTFLSIIPDIFYIPFAISLVVIFYQYTDILLFNIADDYQNKAIVFPILVLSIIPFVNSSTYLNSILDDESNSNYIQFSKSKGLTKKELFYHHILRNLTISYLINFKHIIWITLSSLLLLERIFNIHGLSSFIFDYGDPEVLFVTFILIYIPISLSLLFIEKIITRMTGILGGL